MDLGSKRKITKRFILICWVSLLACMLIKLFGGNYFEIISKSEIFVGICEWIDGKFIKEIIRFIFLNLSYFLYVCSICKRNLTLKEFAICEIFIIIDTIAKYTNSNLGFVADCLMLFISPLIISKFKWKHTIIGFLLINAFQLISLFTRNIELGILENTMLIEIILQVDYYIMLVLYYLYSVKLKGEKT